MFAGVEPIKIEWSNAPENEFESGIVSCSFLSPTGEVKIN